MRVCVHAFSLCISECELTLSVLCVFFWVIFFHVYCVNVCLGRGKLEERVCNPLHRNDIDKLIVCLLLMFSELVIPVVTHANTPRLFVHMCLVLSLSDTHKHTHTRR